jgi:hypothetical protein
MMTTLLSARLTSFPRSAVRAAVRSAACLALALAAAAPAFAQTPQPVLLADFNRDGIPDALVVSTTAPTATIAFGSVPYGTFSPAAKAVTFPAACTGSLAGPNTDFKRGGTLPRALPVFTPQPAGSLQAADFNGDGFPDLAFFCGGSAGTMLGNGDGTFGTATTLSGIASFSGLVGDFNNDGKLDIVVLSTVAGNNGLSQSLQFLAGKGDGTFQEAVLSNLTENAYSTMVAADINGDGFTDLVLINSPQSGSQTMEVLGNNQDGTFGSAYQGFYSPSVSQTVSSNGNLSLLTGNFFGPATTDVVVASAAQNGQLFSFQNTSSGTTYSFNDPVTIPVANLSFAAAGKFTGSGFTDVAVSNTASISVLTNDGKSNFAASYPTLTLPSPSSLFSVADANGDGYADIYTANVDDSGVLSVAASVTTGSATATSQPFSLSVGTQAVSASWNGNVNLLGSTANGQQIVNGAVTVASVASNKNPSTFGDSVTFTVSVAGSLPSGTPPTGAIVLADGTATLASGTLTNGAFSYTTAALTQATHSITAVYAGDNYFAPTTSPVLAQVVNHAPAVAPNLTWATPAPIIQGTPLSSTQLNAAATDASGAAIPGTFAYTPPAGTVLGAGTATLSVTFTPADLLSFLPATATVSLVVEPSVGATITAPPTTTPGSQASITVTLKQAYPIDLTGTLTIGFTRAGTPQLTDPSLQFAAGGTTLSFTIPANTTTVPPVQLQAGTIAGTITVPLTLTANGVNVTPAGLAPATIVVPAAVPAVSGITITRSGTQLTVVMHGFSNTREVGVATFHFTAAPGADLGTPDITLPVSAIFNSGWFDTAPSEPYGSTFTYTQIFNIGGDAASIGSVDATLTNSIGASTSITAK